MRLFLIVWDSFSVGFLGIRSNQIWDAEVKSYRHCRIPIISCDKGVEI